ncbi:MAG: GEVED domain-containing protein, partial [Flavobacteriaceae bacterium]
MRKTKYWFGLLTLCVMLISAQQINAQLYNVAGTCTMNVASNVYGPMYSTTNSDAASRTAVIYPASQLTGIAGQELTSIYFNRIGATTDPAGGTPNFKVYLKETSDVDFGTAALDWATVVTGATLVYDSDPLTAMQGGLGWKQFTFNEDNFTYSGTNNLILLMEYVNTGNTTNVQWQYEYISPCVDTSNSMTTKYVNTTDGTPGASLSSQNYRRPQIAFDFTVDCPAPTNIIISDITTTGITIDWTAGETETTWDYVIQSQGSGIPTVFSQATSTTLTVSDLSPSTGYEFYIRANCGGDDGESVWVGPVNFSTSCDTITILPYTENFDTYGVGSDAFPNCWERPVAYDNGTVWPSIVAVSADSSPNSLRFQSAVGTPTYAVSPEFAEDINNLRVKFNLRREGTSSGTIDFGVMSDPFDLSTFELVQTIDPTDNVFHEYLFNLNTTTLSGGNNYVAFRHNSNSNIWYYWLDDFVVELIPSCLEPSDLTVANVTDNSADLDWSSDGTLFDIKWGIVGFDIDTEGTEVNGVSNPYSLSGLTQSTAYEFYVRQDCGAGDLSAWSGPYYFFTGYCEVTSTSTTNGIGNFTTTGGIMNINNSSTGGSYSNYTTQSVAQFEGGADVQFTITAANGTTGMGVWIDWNNDLDFDDPGEHIYNSAAYTATGSGTITIPSGTPVGNYRMRVVANWLSTNPTPCGDLGNIAYGEAEDYTFTVIDPPTCMPPTQLG